jgi:hypothetical protein
LLRKRVKKIKVLKQKVGKLKEIIKELRKQLEQADKAYERKKSKRPRTQGRNPLPRRTVHTSSVGTQTELHVPEETTEMEAQTEIPATEETTAQPEEVIPTYFPAPLETIDAETQTDVPTTEETTFQTEETFQSPEQSVVINRLEAELVQAQQALIQSKDEMVTMAEHQRVVKQLKSMSAIENETYAELTRAQGKTKKIQGQLDKSLEKIKEIFSIYVDIVACRAPATNYTLFLLERYLLLRVKSIRAGKPFEFTTISEFVSCFREQEEGCNTSCVSCTSTTSSWGRNRKDNPIPFIGDIQFQAFLSFTKNQTRWAKAHKVFMKRETGLDLWIRGEPPKSFPAIMRHKTFMKREKVVDSLALSTDRLYVQVYHILGSLKKKLLLLPN